MNKEKILKLTVVFSLLFIIFITKLSLAYIPGDYVCSDLTTSADCLADSSCCWSSHWGICFGTGEKCCHTIACSKGSPFCNQCPNDALNCYVCLGNNAYQDVCAGNYPDCQGKTIGDSCQSSAFKKCDSKCNCVCTPNCVGKVCGDNGCGGSCGTCSSGTCNANGQCVASSCVLTLDYLPYTGPTFSCTLPGGVCQEGDVLHGSANVNEIPCHPDPVIQVSITASGCSITGTATGTGYVASGPGNWYGYQWTMPQVPAGCLGKTATLLISSQGKSVSRTIKLSPSPTQNNPPTMPRYGTWSPSPILPNSMITYTAHAEDDIGLSQIKIFFGTGVTPSFTLVKTCSVSGTSEDCSFTATSSYSAGTQLCFYGNATDTMGQTPYSFDPGTKRDCDTVCDFAKDTGVSKNYQVKGSCTPSCSNSAFADFCPWPSSPGFCCKIIGSDWYSTSVNNADGTVSCCEKNNGQGPCLGTTQTINCTGVLGKYSANVAECDVAYHDCLQSSQTCSNGACGGTCTPSCSGKQCGSDGCGINNNCGTCSSGTCNANGQCVVCTPNCAGKQCGSDGCSGSCGTCTSPQTCNASGQCVTGCTPNCAGKQCGSDGCSGSCGTCSSGTCNSTGQCVVCTPNCAGKQCGSDGCSGSCGTCQQGYSCDYNSQCIFGIQLRTGWNMFSTILKTMTTDQIKTTCGTTNPILTYNSATGGYSQATQIVPGKGYWIKLSSDCTLDLDSTITVNDIPNLLIGWNQIGGPSTSVIFNNVKGTCAVISSPLKYNPATRGYSTSSTLDPGIGYWVKVTNDCKLA